MVTEQQKHRREYGQHFTSIQIFQDFIFPEIKQDLQHYIWVDMYCGSGNLILPILNHIDPSQRIEFFKHHIFLFDIQDRWIEESQQNATSYGIPLTIAQKNITKHDSLKNPPMIPRWNNLPICHLTNPPYLYLGYIVKTQETHKYLPLFKGKYEGLQDLYQIALLNDLQNGIDRMIYLIPTNFLFGNSSANQIRKVFFPWYSINKAIIFEKQMFKFTGTNVMIGLFQRKPKEELSPIKFLGVKHGSSLKERLYTLYPEDKYKAGAEFRHFLLKHKKENPILIKYYLKLKEITVHEGKTPIRVLDSNDYQKSHYSQLTFKVTSKFAQYVKSNCLWIRTVDTGHYNGRTGFYSIKESFNVDGIAVTSNTYRTNPIQVFFLHSISPENQIVLASAFNQILEYLREITDSDFLTTYKYSGAEYTRKYLGLTQVKQILSIFPNDLFYSSKISEFKSLIKRKSPQKLIDFLDEY